METAHPVKLWNKDFLLWLIGSGQSALGSSLAGIAMSFLVYRQTGSVSAMGVTLALSMLPALLSPFAGTLVDRIPLRVPLALGNLLRGVIQLGLGLATLSGHIPMPVVFALAFVNGLIGVLYGPASMSVLPNVVPKNQIARASGLMASVNQTANLLGLVGGGFLVAQIGTATSLIVDGASFLLMALLVVFVKLPAKAASRSGASFWSDFKGGLAYVRGSVLMMSMPLIALVINASFAPMEMLIPKRMTELGAGAAGYGLYFGLFTGGMALGSVVMAALGGKVKHGPTSALGLVVAGGVSVALAFTSAAWQMYVLAALTGAAIGITNVCISTLFLTLIDAEYRGRVGSLLGMVGMIGVPATLLLLAPIADSLSVGAIFGTSGVVTILGGLLWGLAQRKERAASSPLSSATPPA
ncbi:MFS transporter [Deinococcus yavapaiensis]|uniref:DHA3 family macrolide efflux protein-like MFS transporter n=1 Tax=Deinococcus yavapaiensis KR-236 TaxID=694435 RepID=A0A318S4D2_9DEIO|nr:MFS transporter [Deinococcus yavapaiensis]PYE51918.1 DHA3 family macrolide efflux protein-like MFS transporter [Deinococcus yavapaiensis KR-236]